MINKILTALRAKNTANEMQALVFEELDDSQASAVTGGLVAQDSGKKKFRVRRDSLYLSRYFVWEHMHPNDNIIP